MACLPPSALSSEEDEAAGGIKWMMLTRHPPSRVCHDVKSAREGGKKRRDDKSILERWIGKSSPLARTTGRPNKINIYIDGHVTESRVAFFARCVQYLKLARVLFLHLSILVFFTFPAAGMIG